MSRKWIGRYLGVAATVGILAAAGCKHEAGAPARPIPHAHIYPAVSAAQGDIAAALQTAGQQHKRVLLDFGGDWCGDCQVLNIYFHQPENKTLLDQHFVLVDVNIGHFDQNLDVGSKYGVTINHGVPALAVVQPDGSVLHAQNGGEFRDMRHMESSSVHDFLEKWQ